MINRCLSALATAWIIAFVATTALVAGLAVTSVSGSAASRAARRNNDEPNIECFWYLSCHGVSAMIEWSEEAMKQPVQRHLAAILAADVVAYSRLMGVDEEGTHERLGAHFQEVLEPKIGEHRGRIVKNTGDGMLVEFASVVSAVRCAVEVQR